MGSIATQNNTKWPGFWSLLNQIAGFPITGVLLDIAQDKTSYCPMSMWSHTWHVKNTKCNCMCIHAVAQVIPLIQIQDIPMSLCLQFLPCYLWYVFLLWKKQESYHDVFVARLGLADRMPERPRFLHWHSRFSNLTICSWCSFEYP